MRTKQLTLVAVLAVLSLGAGLIMGCGASEADSIDDLGRVDSDYWAGTWRASSVAGDMQFVQTYELRQQGFELYGTFSQAVTHKGCESKGQARVQGKLNRENERHADLSLSGGANITSCTTHTINWQDGSGCLAIMAPDLRSFECQWNTYMKQ